MQAVLGSHGDLPRARPGRVVSHHDDAWLATVPGRRSGSLPCSSGGGLGVSPSARPGHAGRLECFTVVVHAGVCSPSQVFLCCPAPPLTGCEDVLPFAFLWSFGSFAAQVPACGWLLLRSLYPWISPPSLPLSLPCNIFTTDGCCFEFDFGSLMYAVHASQWSEAQPM